ncbi:LysR family transcriptional regulator, partial [Vibrio cholerae]
MLRDYDLNLLTVFDSVMKLGSVSKAADKLGMTSAAVSQKKTKKKK